MSSEPRTTTFNRFNSRSYNAEIAQLQTALDDGYTDNNFSGYIKPVPHFKAVIGRLFLKIILTFTSEHFFFIRAALQRNAATLRKVLAPFSFSHVIIIPFLTLFSFVSLSLFHDFMVDQFWPLSLSRNAPLSQREGPGTIVYACS